MAKKKLCSRCLLPPHFFLAERWETKFGGKFERINSLALKTLCLSSWRKLEFGDLFSLGKSILNGVGENLLEKTKVYSFCEILSLCEVSRIDKTFQETDSEIITKLNTLKQNHSEELFGETTFIFLLFGVLSFLCAILNLEDGTRSFGERVSNQHELVLEVSYFKLSIHTA
eukprot:snap_masked-scaffold_20-processed-gene-4.36-mRNA-1 protein AED:1.00 eAED:1.00 QI:0/0/0/0/1/1/2/0/170